MQKLATYLFISSVLFLTACKKDIWYDVEPEFEAYINEFEENAASHGYTLDIEELGLIMQFGDLAEEQSGLCHYEDPIRIEIDKTTWNRSSYSNKKQIIFHQMGHGFLNRDHDNTKLQNGEWKSIMRGNPLPEWSSPVVNFSGLREAYYIDELFDSESLAPWWASHYKAYDSITANMVSDVLRDDFDTDATHAEWPVSESAECTTSIKDGQYQVENHSSSDIFITVQHPLDYVQNVQIECEFEISEFEEDAYSGLLWGGTSEGNAYVNAYNGNHSIIFRNKDASMTYYKNYSSPLVRGSAHNKITIRKLDSLYYYYFNENFLYFTDLKQIYGNRLGFAVGSNSSIHIDEFSVAYINTLEQ